MPSDDRTPNATHLGGTGLDFRGYGGGVKHAPSVGYTMQRSPAEGLEPLPAAAKALLLAAKVKPQAAPAAGKGLQALLETPPSEGGRNDWLSRVAGHYAREHRPHEAYLESVRSANELLLPPLASAEVEKTADSIWKAEQEAVKLGTGRGPGALTDTGKPASATPATCRTT